MKGKIIFCVGFVLVILLPSILMFTTIEDKYKNDENRALTDLDFSKQGLKMSIVNFKNYFTDNFGGRFLFYNFYKKNIS